MVLAEYLRYVLACDGAHRNGPFRYDRRLLLVLLRMLRSLLLALLLLLLLSQEVVKGVPYLLTLGNVKALTLTSRSRPFVELVVESDRVTTFHAMGCHDVVRMLLARWDREVIHAHVSLDRIILL